MNLIDTHAHLYLPAFKNDIDEVMKRAKSTGLSRILMPNIDSASIRPMNELCQQYPELLMPMIGLHPTSVKENYKEEFAAIHREIMANHRKYTAIGETGIDLYWEKAFIYQQKEVFMEQLNLASELNLPIVIHTRDSFTETMDVIGSMKLPVPSGVFHCFSGNEDDAAEAVKLGFFLGIGGVLTFKNSNMRQWLGSIDLQHILLETDAPFLAPVPHRGKRNESSYLSYVISELASIYGKPEDEIADITTANAKKLFRLEQ